MFETQIAPTAHMSCNDCGRKIVRGEIRLRTTYGMMYVSHNYYCDKCAIKVLDEETNVIKGLKENIKKHMEENENGIKKRI